MREMINILIVDCSEETIKEYKKVLGRHREMKIVGCVSNLEETLNEVKEKQPDFLLLDIAFKDEEDIGINVAIETAIVAPDTNTIIISEFINENTVRNTIGLGVANNYLLKKNIDRLPQILMDICEGKTLLEEEVIEILVNDYKYFIKNSMNKLTNHHINVLELFYREYSVDQVASILKVEVQSVRNLQQEIAKRTLDWKWRFHRLSAKELAQRAKLLGLF